jgi:hypothetical protein
MKGILQRERNEGSKRISDVVFKDQDEQRATRNANVMTLTSIIER